LVSFPAQPFSRASQRNEPAIPTDVCHQILPQILHDVQSEGSAVALVLIPVLTLVLPDV